MIFVQAPNSAASTAATTTTTPTTSSSSSSTSQPPPNVAQSPFGLGSMGGMPGLADMGMGSANFMDMQQRMQREVSFERDNIVNAIILIDKVHSIVKI